MALINDLIDIYNKTLSKNVKNGRSLYRFERNKSCFLNMACNDIDGLCSNPIKYNIFVIFEPKPRIIMSLGVKDKLVNHYVAKYILEDKLTKYLCSKNIATRKNMGTSYGIRLIKKYLEENKKYKEFYILKMDISKYFYNIDHNVLLSLLDSKLNKDEYEIIKNILASTNASYINKEIKYIKDKYNIKEINDIPYYEYGKGLPIGNMTSQFLSVFYLYKIDNYIIHTLGLKYYVRYMDDFLIVHHDKKYLNECKNKIIKKLKEEFLLDVSDKKTIIYNSKKGVPFLGKLFYIKDGKTIVKTYSKSRRKIFKNYKNRRYMYDSNKINYKSMFGVLMNYSNCYEENYIRINKRLK